MDQTRAGLSQPKPTPATPAIAPGDRAILRSLAAHVAELAARPVESQKRDLWLKHNALEPTRPLIFCDPENGWNEIFPPASLRCVGDLARQWEMRLRKEIFWAEQLRDDRVIQSEFTVAHVYRDSGWGLLAPRIEGGHNGAYIWESPLKDYAADFPKLRQPEIQVDTAATDRLAALAHETLGDLLPVRVRTSWWWTLGLTWTLASLRGLEQIMFDMLDRPDDLHRLMAFLRDGTLARIADLERQGLLTANTDGAYVGSGGFGWLRPATPTATNATVAHTANRHATTHDMWGFCESQETVGVSPAAFREFVLPYQLPILARFKLACYGCCEPLDQRWEAVATIPNLRRVSVSPWSNTAKMSEKLGAKYLFSWKPSPTNLALTHFDESLLQNQVREVFAQTRHCRVEAIMKDNHTLQNDPTRAIRWVQLARAEADRL